MDEEFKNMSQEKQNLLRVSDHGSLSLQRIFQVFLKQEKEKSILNQAPVRSTLRQWPRSSIEYLPAGRQGAFEDDG